MTLEVARLSRAGRIRIQNGLRRSWQPGGAHDLRFHHAPVDADTLRKRELFDRRGTHYATVRIGAETYTLRWSVCGRVDQLDAHDSRGGHVLTLRPDKMLVALHDLSAPIPGADQPEKQ